MKKRYLNWLLAGAAAFSMIGLAACGGDDDDPSDGDSTPGSGENSSADDAANGTDNENGADNTDGASSASSEDVDYVRSMCTAVMNFDADSREATSDLDAEAGQEEVMEAIAGPFRNLAEATAEADPPSDLSSAHEDMVANFEEVADGLEAGEPEAMQMVQSIQVNPEVEQRMAAVGPELEECQGLFAAPGAGSQPGSGTPESGGAEAE